LSEHPELICGPCGFNSEPFFRQSGFAMSAVNQFRRADLNVLGNSAEEISFVPARHPAVNDKSLFGQLRGTLNVRNRCGVKEGL
jgi:hypothetical protein